MAHYPGFAILAGESLRYVAEQGGRWLALRGWGAVAFKCGPRDTWIVWSKSQQLRRCRCVANNLRRLFGDWQPILGHPIALAEMRPPGHPTGSLPTLQGGRLLAWHSHWCRRPSMWMCWGQRTQRPQGRGHHGRKRPNPDERASLWKSRAAAVGRRLTISKGVVRLAHEDGLAPDQLPSSAGTGHAQVAQLVASRSDQGRRHYRDSVGPTVCSSPGCDYEGVEEFFS